MEVILGKKYKLKSEAECNHIAGIEWCHSSYAPGFYSNKFVTPRKIVFRNFMGETGLNLTGLGYALEEHGRYCLHGFLLPAEEEIEDILCELK